MSNSKQALTTFDEFLEQLDSLGIRNDLHWVAMVLFARNLVQELSIFEQEQKAQLQRDIFRLLRDRTQNEQASENALETLEVFMVQNQATRELEEALEAERKSASRLLDELSVFVSGFKNSRSGQESNLERFGKDAAEAVESGKSRAVIVSNLRSLVTRVVQEFKEEAEEWSRRAEELENTAKFDPLLCEMANRRTLDAFLSTSLADDGPLSLMMIDVDHFKRVNDTYGHQVGDEILKALGSIICAHSSDFDGFPARYGGEELAVVCPGMTLAQAGFQAEAIRLAIARQPILHTIGDNPKPVPVTVSIGLAEQRPGWRPRDLVQAADKALYAAKRAGRNQVIAFRDEMAV